MQDNKFTNPNILWSTEACELTHMQASQDVYYVLK